MQTLASNVAALYAALLDDCLGGAAPSGRGLSFVTKRISGRTHWYLQVTVGSRKSQHYLGPDTVELARQISDEKSLWEQANPRIRERQRLVRMLLSGGAQAVSSAEARVLEILERAGIFLAGGVLVGSQPWDVYPNMLGVGSGPGIQSKPTTGRAALRIGLPAKSPERKQAVVNSGMGLFEIPILDKKSTSTAFQFRGQDVKVDILTPALGKSSNKPIYLSAPALSATPTPFLDYLLQDAQPAVVVAKAGILVNVPKPACYAVHELATDPTKQRIEQISELLVLLLRDRAADLRQAWRAALQQPPGFARQLNDNTRGLPPTTRSALQDLVN